MALPKVSGIYEIVNTFNGKRYIGSAVSVRARWVYHRRDLRGGRHHSPYLQRAWNKYGERSFRVYVVEVVSDPHRLVEREQHHIDAASPEYNASPTAGSCLGYRWSDERRKARSERNKRMWRDKAFAARMQAAMKAGITEEVRALASQRMRENNPFRGKSHTKETRRLLSQIKKDEWSDPEFRRLNLPATLSRLHSPEARAKRAQKMRGRSMPEDVRKKIGRASLRMWRDPDYREKRAASLKAALALPEVKARKSRAMKKAWQDKDRQRRASERMSGRNNPAAISTQYSIINTEGDVLTGVPVELRARTGISPAGMSQLINGKQATTKGWRLHPEQEDNHG